MNKKYRLFDTAGFFTCYATVENPRFYRGKKKA